MELKQPHEMFHRFYIAQVHFIYMWSTYFLCEIMGIVRAFSAFLIVNSKFDGSGDEGTVCVKALFA